MKEKIIIDDAAVGRAWEILDPYFKESPFPVRANYVLRWALEAAFNPPPEPEIEVTLDMATVGNRAYQAARNAPCMQKFGDIYRAMERERRRAEAQSAPKPACKAWPDRYPLYHIMGDGGISFHMRAKDNPRDVAHQHRRKDDPQ